MLSDDATWLQASLRGVGQHLVCSAFGRVPWPFVRVVFGPSADGAASSALLYELRGEQWEPPIATPEPGAAVLQRQGVVSPGYNQTKPNQTKRRKLFVKPCSSTQI